MNKNFVINSFIVASWAAPIMLLADDLGTTIDRFSGYALSVINFLLVLATLVFLWGIVKYITAGGDAGKITEARTYILWGLIGLAIMGSVWAITRWAGTLLGGTVGGTQQIPKYSQ